MNRAKSSLPVPVSPRIRTGTSDWASRAQVSRVLGRLGLVQRHISHGHACIRILTFQSHLGEPRAFPGVGYVEENYLIEVPDRQKGQDGARHLLAADEAQCIWIVEDDLPGLQFPDNNLSDAGQHFFCRRFHM
jgi:hypothetical protein